MDEIYRVEVVADYVDRTEPGMSRTRAKVTAFERGLARTERRLRSWGRSMSTVGRNMTRWFTIPILGAAAASVKFYMDFQKSMTDIRALVGASSRQMRMYEAEVLRMSRTLPQGPQALADALYFVTSSGFKGAEALSVLKASAKAAAAGLGDTQTVADAVTSAVNAYGVENLKAARATDILLATVREGKAEPTELAGSIGRVIAPAEAMGVSFDQVGAAIAALSLTGLDAAEAVTGFRGILMTLMKPTAAGAKALRNMGTSIEAVQMSIRRQGFMPTMVKLRNEFGYTAEEAKKLAKEPLGNLKIALGENYEALGKVFGNVRAMNAFLALTGRNVEKNSKLFKDLKNAVGDTGRAFREAKKDPMFQFQKAMANLKTTLIEVAPTIMPVVERLLRMVEGWARAIGKMDVDKLERWVKALGMLAIAGPILRLLGGGAKLGAGLIGGGMKFSRWLKYGSAAAGAGGAAGGGSAAAGAASSLATGAGAATLGTATGLALPLGLIGAAIWDGFEEKRRAGIRQGAVESGPGTRRFTRARSALGIGREDLAALNTDIASFKEQTAGRNMTLDEERALNGLLAARRSIWRELRELERDATREQVGRLQTQLGMLESVGGKLTENQESRLQDLVVEEDYAGAVNLVKRALKRANDEYVKQNRNTWKAVDGFQAWTDSTFAQQSATERLMSQLQRMGTVGTDSLLALIDAYGSAERAARQLVDANNAVNWGWEGAGGGGGNGGGGKGKGGKKHDYPHTMRVRGPGVASFPIGPITETISFGGKEGAGGGGRASVVFGKESIVIRPNTLDDDAIDEVVGKMTQKVGAALGNLLEDE